MSASVFHQVIGRVTVDETFRKEFFADQKAALAGYDLTDDERKALTLLDESQIVVFAGRLDPRLIEFKHTGGY